VDLPGIEADILAAVSAPARQQLGLAVQQIGIRRITLPENNTPAVFERMRAERAQFASRFRAEGRRRADEIRVEAEVEAGRMVAEARAYAEQRRGEAEAEAARIYREAHAANPAFYRFLRELETLRLTLDDRTVLLLETDSPVFRLLQPGKEIWWLDASAGEVTLESEEEKFRPEPEESRP
jgi:membrane protease subunit HflC